MDYDASRYHRYTEMTDMLQALAATYPNLCRLESIGTSPEGRDIWSVTLTNYATGADTVKPAYHLNGQHHAGEVTAGAVALYTVHWLLTNYGTDRRATELLDTRAVYVVPRIAVDGAEFYFDNPLVVRSSPLHYPEPEEQEGLVPADLNGDGRILTMRIPHPQGDWKISDKDPRIMLRRQPDEVEGTFYRLLVEGEVRGEYKGRDFKVLGTSAYDPSPRASTSTATTRPTGSRSTGSAAPVASRSTGPR